MQLSDMDDDDMLAYTRSLLSQQEVGRFGVHLVYDNNPIIINNTILLAKCLNYKEHIKLLPLWMACQFSQITRGAFFGEHIIQIQNMFLEYIQGAIDASTWMGIIKKKMQEFLHVSTLFKTSFI